jgi:hypothetical protein
MGGAAGHLQHLYENLGLTFGEIKEVLSSAAEGKLEKTSEKMDGMNVMFTWARGELKVARTGSDVKGGGMDATGLAKKFFGRGNVEEAFNSAFKVLHQALGTLSERDTSVIFGGGRRWYSMEIIYAKDPNTINYDSNNIVFHGWPIFEVQDDGSVEQSDDDSGVSLLTKRIDQMQRAVTQRDWQVRGPSLLRLKKLGDGSILQRAITQINGAMGSGGVNDTDTVYDYLRNLFADDAKQLGLPNKAHKMTVERCTGAPSSPTVNDIKKETPKDKQAAMQAYVRDSEAAKAKWMAPIEGAIHFFAIEVLRGLHSTLVSKSDDEVARLRSQLGRAIRTIEKSGHQAAMDVLQKEMSRLGNVENFGAAMEGIVFFFKGQAYKFTGAFAPAHQIMALFKYGRKGIPKMDLGERKLQMALKRLLQEGGGMEGAEPITLADFKRAWPTVKQDLDQMGVTDITFVGTTGKKNVMGDVDVAGRFDGTRDELFDLAASLYGRDHVAKVGPSIVSMRIDGYAPKPFQVDVMLGNPSYLKWARYAPSNIEGHLEFSPVKGLARNLLFNIITRFAAGKNFPGVQQSDTERTRYTVDWDRGLWKVVQTKRAAKGNKVNKEWRTLDRTMVSDDPDVIVQKILGKGHRAENLRKLEDVIAAIKKSPELRDVKNDILGSFAKELPEYGDKLGTNVEGIISYVRRLIRENVLREQALTQSPASNAYEKNVLKSIETAGAQGNIKSIAGSNKHMADADIKINDVIYLVEVKMDSHAQMGGGSVGWSPDVGFFPTGTGDVDDIVTRLNHDKLLNDDIGAFIDLVNDELMGKETVTGFPMTIPKSTYVSLVKADMVKPLNRTFEYDIGFVFNHYAQKGTNYIQVGSKGLFFMAANPARLPVPLLTGRMQLEFRPGPAGSKLNATGERRKQVSLRVQARLKIDNVSPYTLDDAASVEQLIDAVKPRELELVPRDQTASE